MSDPQKISDRQKAKQAHALLSRYERLYRENQSRRITFNRYAAKWGMMDVIDSVGVDRAAELLDYFFTTKGEDKSIEYFYRNFDKMDNNERLQREDRQRRAELRRQTEQRIRESGN